MIELETGALKQWLQLYGDSIKSCFSMLLAAKMHEG